MSKPFAFLSIDAASRRVSLDARDPAFYRDPNPVYAALHAHCPTFYWEEQKQWYFTGYDQVNALLRDRRFGRQILHVASREELGMAAPMPHLKHFDAAEAWSLLELEPPEHTRLRTLVNRAFVSRQIDRLRPEITALANGLIDRFETDGRVELLSALADIVPVTMIARMIGIPDAMGPQLLKWSHAYVRMYMFGRTGADERAADRAAEEFADYVRSVIAERRTEPRDDLLSHMIHTEHKGQLLTDDELISTTIVLLNAGHEATVHQIGNAVRVILDSGLPPQPMFADETATGRTVEECLRICAPVHIFQRYALEDVEVEGIPFRRGDKVALILAAANLDPRKFDDPLAFRPDRDEGANLSFGAGIHFCIGAPLARLELNIVLPLLFQRLPGLRLAQTPTVKDVYHFHGLERLDLEW
ncbi:cytochrome P450 [Rhizobium sp. TRM96647]|uniref:cytochrome P450 n=1 Tax=unclassified Rhizobium TaxID=2613769 RepID=UPI0021E8A3A4|nr:MULTISPECIES: cytochrome P450 [unclassified Rhizobium]MCV3738244.1 cytochrome P450 [Rhizobium sp. TRM96647]MCV3760007.1 cytochrome P450 [Rhizobium sp. TRM96650]